jgi:hypothetical protein
VRWGSVAANRARAQIRGEKSRAELLQRQTPPVQKMANAGKAGRWKATATAGQDASRPICDAIRYGQKAE